MQEVIIQARSYDSAQSLYSALAQFFPELLGTDIQGYTVSVQLGNAGGELLRLLEAIERYVTERHIFVRVEMDGHRYTVHGDDVSGSADPSVPMAERAAWHGEDDGDPRDVAAAGDFVCAECGRQQRERETALDEWRAYEGDDGELYVFCLECAEQEFGERYSDGVC
jgi:hypothetical protein